MTAFPHVIAALAADGTDLRIETPDDWAQGRTLYGGMTAALAHAAARHGRADPGPLRSAQLTFVGPATGALRFRPTLLREGRSSTIVAVDCLAEGGVAARATFAFGWARESLVRHDRVPAPAVSAPEDCPPFHRTTRPLTGFLANFEYRRAAATHLFQPEAAPEFAVWTRFREEAGDDAEAALLALTDALPCAAMAAFPKPAPVSTLSWSIDLVQPLPPRTEWRLVQSASEQAADGYSLQAMRVFDRDGRLLALSRQMVAIFT